MFKQIYTTLGIALAYVVLAQVGFLVSLLPGQDVTLLWPPSGVALAAVLVLGGRALPGIALGALLTNLLEHYTAPGLTGPIIAGSTAAASTLSALVGGVALKRIAPAAPERIRATEMLLGCLALALACTIAASGGVGSLYAAGLMPRELLMPSWGVWWAGDFCGMMIFGPTIWLVATYIRTPGRRLTSGPMAAIGLVNSLVAIAGLITFSALWASETNGISQSLKQESKVVADRLMQELRTSQHDLHAIRALIYSSKHVTAAGFQQYSAEHFSNRDLDPGAQAVGWVPRVTDIAAWETRMQYNGESGVQLYELDQSGQRIPVALRQEYFPVEYIQPLEGNQAAVGFDLGSERQRRSALERARDSGKVAMVSPINLVQVANEEYAMFICLPIYSPGMVLDTVESRRNHLTGFASGVYLLSVLFGNAAIGGNVDVDLHLFDESFSQGDLHYHHQISLHRSNFEGANTESTLASLQQAPNGLSRITFANHTWLVLATPGPTFLQKQRTWTPWVVLAAILALGIAMNSILSQRIAARKYIAVERQKATDAQLKLQTANESKAYLMAAAAHDIKQPLYALGILADTLSMTRPQESNADIVSTLKTSIEQMLVHFDTLMDVGRFHDGIFEVVRSSFRLGHLCERINQEIAPLCASKGLAWKLDMDDVMVSTDEELLLRLLRNLLVNAVQYTATGEVCCSAKATGDVVEFIISDTGVGIEKDQQDTVFGKFVRLEKIGVASEGLGLGLSIVEKINQTLELGLKMRSIPGEGTRFSFRLPITPRVE